MSENLKITFQFPSSASVQEALDWAQQLTKHLPEGATMAMEALPTVLSADELTKEHIGKHVRVSRKADKRTVQGILEGVFPVTGERAVSLVVAGSANRVGSFELVEVEEAY